MVGTLYIIPIWKVFHTFASRGSKLISGVAVLHWAAINVIVIDYWTAITNNDLREK